MDPQTVKIHVHKIRNLDPGNSINQVPLAELFINNEFVGAVSPYIKLVFGSGKGKTKPVKSNELEWDVTLVLVNKDKV